MTGLAVDPTAVLAACVGALLVSLESILGKRGIVLGAPPLLASVTSITITAVVFVSATLLVVGPEVVFETSSTAFALFFLAGSLNTGIGMIALYEGVDRVGASVSTAIANSRPLLVAVLGWIFLMESLGAATVGGILLLVFGLIVIAISNGGDIYGWRPIELAFPLCAAVSFAIGNVVRRYGLTETSIPLVEALAINSVAGLVVVCLYVVVTDRLDIFLAPRRAFGWFVCSGLCTTGLLAAMFFALERERVAIVDSIMATAPIFTLVLTLVLLRDLERITLRVAVGTTLVVTGAIAIVAV